MENLAFLAPLLFIAGVAVIILAIIAVVQDMKQEHKYGYRQAFFTIVTLVMLVMAVGSGISLMALGLKQGIFTSAKTYNNNRMNSAPAPYLSGVPEKGLGLTTAYTCPSDCQFTAVDKQNFSDWKAQYTAWKDANTSSQQLRRDLAGGLALFLISLPLFFLFSRWMNRGSVEESQQHQRPSPLRSVYYYGVAFAGLVMAVVGGAMLLNTVLKVALHTTSTAVNSYPTPTSVTVAADSVIGCADKCGFTADDVALVKDWKSVNAAALDTQKSTTGSTANDLGNTLPYVLVGIPLFWYHFARIRKETQPQTPATPDHTA